MTTSQNDFKKKYKEMYKLFQDNHTSENNHIYRSTYKDDNLIESASFSIQLPAKSTDLTECDKFYELFYSKTQLNNDSNNKESIDKDGVKYTSYLYRNKSNTTCNFDMTYNKKIQSKYF
jgi:hypothetical protein